MFFLNSLILMSISGFGGCHCVVFFRMYVDTDLHLFLLAGYLANDIAKLYVDGKRVCMQEV